MERKNEEPEKLDKKTIIGIAFIAVVITASFAMLYNMNHKDDRYDQFGLELLDYNVGLMDIYAKNGALVIEYVPDVQDQFSVIEEIGNIAFSFANHYDEYNVKRLDARVVDATKALGATWTCEGEWVERYHEGNMSLNELMWKCVSTIEVTEG